MKLINYTFLIGLFLMTILPSCKQENPTVQVKEINAPIKYKELTPEQNDLIKTHQENKRDTLTEESKRYEAFIEEIRHAETTEEMQKIAEKYKELTKTIQ